MSSPTGSDELTRKQRREQARAERRAAEEAERARAARRRRMSQFGGALVTLVVVAVVVVVAAGSGGKTHNAATTQPVAAGTLPGLQTGNAPWPPEYNSLAQRLQLMNLPTESDAAYHEHAHVQIYVNGKNVTVPAQIGIDPQGQFLAPLHTHDTSGVIHMESSQTYPFTLGQFFNVWGVDFTSSQLGGYHVASGSVLSTYVNGKPVVNPPGYVLKPHDLVVVGFGRPGSFPTSVAYSFAPGL
jgi:hypothetical protein